MTAALATFALSFAARAAEPPKAPAVDSADADPSDPPPQPPSPRLALAGGLLFGSSYAISLIGASISMSTKDAQLPELYVPLAGPWIAIPNILQIQKRRVGVDPAQHQSDWLPAFGFGVLGVAQAIGAVCLTGYLVDKQSTPRQGIAGVRVVPYVGVASAGLAGSF